MSDIKQNIERAKDVFNKVEKLNKEKEVLGESVINSIELMFLDNKVIDFIGFYHETTIKMPLFDCPKEVIEFVRTAKKFYSVVDMQQRRIESINESGIVIIGESEFCHETEYEVCEMKNQLIDDLYNGGYVDHIKNKFIEAKDRYNKEHEEQQREKRKKLYEELKQEFRE